MLMKKILVVHTKYQELGGEDIAVEKEIQLLEKYFDVETLFFDNKIDNYFKQLTSFLINDNKVSVLGLTFKSLIAGILFFVLKKITF